MISLNILVRILKLVLRHKWRLAAAYASIAGKLAAAISVKNQERVEPLPML